MCLRRLERRTQFERAAIIGGVAPETAVKPVVAADGCPDPFLQTEADKIDAKIGDLKIELARMNARRRE